MAEIGVTLNIMSLFDFILVPVGYLMLKGLKGWLGMGVKSDEGEVEKG